MAFYTQYVEYFKHQAETHPALLHLDTNGSKVFAVIDQQAALGDFRTGAKEKGSILRLIEPNGGSEGDSNPLISPLGGFIIARYHAQRTIGDTDQTAAMESSWNIGMDIVAKIMADSANGHPLFFYSVNTPAALQLQWQPRIFAGDVSYAGWMFTFRWKMPHEVCFGRSGGIAWGDGGLTPY